MSASAPSASAPATSEGRTRAAVFTAYGVQGTVFASLVTHVPTLQDRFGFSDGTLGLLLLAVPVIAGLGSVLAGALSTRYGSAAVLRVSQPAVCLSVAAIGGSHHLGTLLPSLAAFGLFVGMVDASAGMQGVLLEQRYARNIMHGFFSVWSFAGILGAGLASLTNHYHQPLDRSLAIVALAGVAASGYTGRWLLHGRPVRTATVPRAAIPWRPIVMVGLVVMFMYVADAATSNFSAHYLQNALHGSDTVGPLAYASYQAAMVLGRAAADRLVDRYGPVSIVRTGGLVALAGIAVVTLAPNPSVAIAGFFVMGAGLCPVAPQAFTAAGQIDPSGSGVAVARINVFNYAGFVLGAPLIGLVTEAVNERVAFGLLLAFGLGIVALAGAYDPQRLRPAAAPEPGRAGTPA
jgi:MFS family permease